MYVYSSLVVLSLERLGPSRQIDPKISKHTTFGKRIFNFKKRVVRWERPSAPSPYRSSHTDPLSGTVT